MSGNPFKKADKELRYMREKNELYWNKKTKTEPTKIYNKTLKNVPAYKEFLKKSNIKTRMINSYSDFKTLPLMDKQNYFHKYQIEDMCINGQLNAPLTYTTTSGSTGKPTYFVRDNKVDWQNSLVVETLLSQGELDRNSPTLVVICFGMGIWIGGIINYKSFDFIANRDRLPISTITPGINKEEILKIFSNLGSLYKQVILVGYPPFIKDVVDAIVNIKGLKLGEKKFQLLFAAEAISEELRDYIAEKLNIKNKFLDIMNIYGSAELGAMAFETGISTLIRKIANSNQKIFNDIFIDSKNTPTLAQFNPKHILFEEVEGKLVVTGDNFMPFVRYDIGDKGGVYKYNEMKKVLEKNGINIEEEARKCGINYIYKLPFVYIYERSNFSASFYGIWVYPGWIRSVFLTPDFNLMTTGRFTLVTKYDRDKNQYLEINIELAPNTESSKKLSKHLAKQISKKLKQKSSEYTELINKIGKRAEPKIVLWKYGDSKYFSQEIKQLWVERS